jgi:hypothetical protein
MEFHLNRNIYTQSMPFSALTFQKTKRKERKTQVFQDFFFVGNPLPNFIQI